MTNHDKIKIHFLREQGMHFVDIARKMGGTAKEMASVYIEVEQKQKEFKTREKVVYRKRMKVRK
ncbi:hypothetical protein KNT81_gp094 [Proteus phage phiP4-3]|uniref:Uncharacterized protein n=1 Tax=Proteus phage phiP4-3 TaxID=2065203 RepID=A0A2I6PFE4_9CAUD|nr:hypothetical protein KNT81_gp094 [Proteus phage phiP4-3]AUM58452.1 hypothetical protein phiP43_094 [Proteus phage phiP4-3]